jgi:hypothetical protein
MARGASCRSDALFRNLIEQSEQNHFSLREIPCLFSC